MRTHLLPILVAGAALSFDLTPFLKNTGPHTLSFNITTDGLFDSEADLDNLSIQANPVPEPATMAALAAALRKRRKARTRAPSPRPRGEGVGAVLLPEPQPLCNGVET